MHWQNIYLLVTCKIQLFPSPRLWGHAKLRQCAWRAEQSWWGLLPVPPLLLNPLYCDHATTSLKEIKSFSCGTDRFCAWLNLNQYFCCLLFIRLIWIIDCDDSHAGAGSKKSVFIYFNVFVSSLQRSWSNSWCIPPCSRVNIACKSRKLKIISAHLNLPGHKNQCPNTGLRVWGGGKLTLLFFSSVLLVAQLSSSICSSFNTSASASYAYYPKV